MWGSITFSNITLTQSLKMKKGKIVWLKIPMAYWHDTYEPQGLFGSPRSIKG